MKRIFLVIIALLLCGCASVISKEVLKDVNREITLPMVQKNPDLYVNRKVLWGGVIISSENLADATLIEVLDTALTGTDRPTLGDSKGRFLVESPGYLDTVVYKSEKLITVAGVVKGVRTKKIGKMDYNYPLITPVEIKLFDPQEVYPPYPPEPPWWWYPPYYPYPWHYYPRPGPPYHPYPGPYYPYPWPYPYPPPPP